MDSNGHQGELVRLGQEALGTLRFKSTQDTLLFHTFLYFPNLAKHFQPTTKSAYQLEVLLSTLRYEYVFNAFKIYI